MTTASLPSTAVHTHPWRVETPSPTLAAEPSSSARSVAVLRWSSGIVLAVVAAAGAVLSFSSLYAAAVPTFGPVLAIGFPLLVDALCLGASLAYAAGAKIGRPRVGWRMTAHGAAAGTVVLNALASPDLAHVPWHVTAPLTWSVLVELVGRELLGTWRATHTVPKDRIPGRLWLTAPVESVRTWLLMARTGASSHAAARLEVGVQAAAAESLRLALPKARRARRILRRQMRAGSLDPVAVLDALEWGTTSDAVLSPEAVMRSALAGVLATRGGDRAGTSSRRTRQARGTTPTGVAGSAGVTPGVTHLTATGVAAGVADPVGVTEPGVADPVPPAVVDLRPLEKPVVTSPSTSSGDRAADADAVFRAAVRRGEELTGPEMLNALRDLGWELSQRTADRELGRARAAATERRDDVDDAPLRSMTRH